jgi:probable biosynthetic protein (TIGR04099 family)
MNTILQAPMPPNVLRDRQHLPDAHYVAGMPHLSYAGLSENWLLKECGQRHWDGIAAMLGLELPDFSDVSGRQAYAAFTAISVSSARLERIVEHDRLALASGVGPAGRSQFHSLHQLRAGDRSCATVQMLSAFVQRLQEGNNQSVVRATLGKDAPERPATPEAQALLQAGKRFRQGLQESCMGLRPAAQAPLREFEFLPCPGSDFNGANFMYFATFQSLVDRAEWTWFRNTTLPPLAERQLYFYGNVNLGDKVRIQLLAQRNDSHFGHWCRVVRDSDGARIADVVTLKQPTAHRRRPGNFR